MRKYHVRFLEGLRHSILKNMKTKIFTFLVIQILLFTNIFAQTDDFEIIWENTYGYEQIDEVRSVIPTIDGGFLIAGLSSNNSWLIKIDNIGNKLWDKTFDNGLLYSMISTKDGCFLITGLTEPKGSFKWDVWLAKIDNNGNYLWDKTYGGDNNDWAKSVISTSDGGFLISGCTYSKGAGKGDIWLIKTDENGNKQWDKTYGGSDSDWANSVISTIDGSFLITGYTKSKGAGQEDVWLIKTDNNGNMLWDKTFGGLNNDEANSVIVTNDEGFLISGYTKSKGVGDADIWLIKTDENGNKIWDKTLGGYSLDKANSTITTTNNSFLITGTTFSKGFGSGDIWLIKIDNYGNIIFDKTFGGNSLDKANSITPTNDGFFIIAGNTMSKGAGKSDIWIIKIKEEVSTLIDKTNPTITLTNPTSTYQKTQTSQFTIKGTVTDDTEVNELKINNNPVNLNGSNFSYNTQLSTGQNIFNLIATDNSGNTTIKKITIEYQPQQTDKIGPDIKITQPDLRGFIVIEQMQYEIKGEVTDPSGVTQVTVNNELANVDAQGNFSKTITLVYGNNPITVIATDKYGNQSSKTFNITRDQQNNDNNITTSDKYYALIIGVSEYTNPKIQDLNNEPTNDAKELKRILTTYYTFEEQNITLLLNPTNSEIIRKFDDLNKIITKNDNFLIFYAGHGYYDPVDKLGYWLPSNADINYTDNWIYNDVLVANIKKTHSKHTLLISDACFSGSIFKTRDIIQDADMNYQKDYAVKSRNAITSGTLKTVPNKSIFFKYLSEKLINNANPFMSASDLFQLIKKPVSNNSPNIPQFGDIQNVGDEGGDFIFIRKDK